MTSVDADLLIRALADPLRAQIIDQLSQEQLCTCQMVDLTGARQTNISNHLRILRDAGLIIAEPAGRYTFYRLNPEAFEVLAARMSHLVERAHQTALTTARRECP